ncbi:MAG: hemolysin family protein, partial [Candidatus Doudnabacteria bacterium]
DKIMFFFKQKTAYEINRPAKEIIFKAIDSGYSRIPIYRENLNNIVGILYTKRLLSQFGKPDQELNLQDFLVPPYFVPNSMKISQVLQRLQKNKVHMALVTDEHGEIEGLVTLEDVLEEIVGDITDETDEVDKNIKPEGNNFLVAGETSVVDFNKYFKTELPENEDFNTVSGFIIEHLGRFPKPGDVINFGIINFTVKETTLRIVKSVIVNFTK